ncbi:MAG: lytic transglycosylase domain-containing protein [Vicinamibacteria bacterium]
MLTAGLRRRAARAGAICAALLALGLAALPARAEIAVLGNGHTFKVDRWRIERGLVRLELRGGGEVGVPVGQVLGFVPDEVADETRAPAAVAAGVPDLAGLIVDTARRHGLDPELVAAVVAVESGYRSDAVSPKGAQGLMQLMPGTAGELGVADAFDAAQNLDGGARHLKALLARSGGNLRQALAAYNAGEAAVARHGGIPPYKETREYVERVLRRYQGGS